MSRLSGPKGVVRQSEFFLYTDKDKEALRALPGPGPALPGDYHLDSRQ